MTPSISNFAGYFTVLNMGTVLFYTLILLVTATQIVTSLVEFIWSFLHSTLPLVVDSEIKISLF